MTHGDAPCLQTTVDSAKVRFRQEPHKLVLDLIQAEFISRAPLQSLGAGLRTHRPQYANSPGRSCGKLPIWILRDEAPQ